MSGAIPPLPQCVFVAWCLVKHRDKFKMLVVEANHGLILGMKFYNLLCVFCCWLLLSASVLPYRPRALSDVFQLLCSVVVKRCVFIEIA